MCIRDRVDNMFVFTTKQSNEVPQGTVGFNGNQRTWGGWSLNQTVQVRPFDLFQYSGKHPYLGSLDIEISFRSKGKAVDTQFEQDDLAKHFLKNFESQIFAPTQYLIFEYKGDVYKRQPWWYWQATRIRSYS